MRLELFPSEYTFYGNFWFMNNVRAMMPAIVVTIRGKFIKQDDFLQCPITRIFANKYWWNCHNRKLICLLHMRKKYVAFIRYNGDVPMGRYGAKILCINCPDANNIIVSHRCVVRIPFNSP